MNKIYKVVWNTVRNCYVVGSELISSKSGRHSISNGKSSSLKVTLTVLALCGMTALGSGVAPAYAADADTAVASQYVAVLVNDSNNYYTSRGRTVQYGDTRTFDGYSYHKETVSGETYWVRDGYTIKYEENERYPGAQKDNIIKAYKTSSYTAASDEGLLKSNQIMIESAGISTLTGVDLDNVSGGTYVGATNSGSTSTPSSFNYMIKDDNGTYVDAGNANFSKRFKAATKNTDGTYSYNGEVIANDNLYVVNEQVGVFLTSSGKVYTGKVFGANNEVLMTTKSDEGTMYSYWGADTPDPNTKLADMTIGQFNQALEKVNNNSKAVAGDTIKEIKTTAKTGGGTIDLVRRGQYNSATGQYEGEYTVGDGITITSHGGTNGEDVKINFSNGTTGFDVAAGSKVEAIKATESTTDITGFKINGETYNIKTTDTTLVAGKAEKKGDSYIVKDTAGNEVTLEDVASANKLTEVNNQVTENTQNITRNTQNITKNTTNITELGEKLKGAVMYDSTATGFNKNNVTLGGTTYDSATKTGGTKITNLARGTNDSDAVNFSQLSEVKDAENYVTDGSLSTTDGTITLNRLKDGPVTITGLKDYVKGIDSYVTRATLNGNTLTLTRNQGLNSLTVDLSSLTEGLSKSDYRVVANPAEGSNGIYTPDDKGNIELTVQDANSDKKTTIKLSDIASATTVNNNYNTLNTKIDAAKTHYFSVNPDNISGAGNYDNDGAVGLDSIAVGAGAYANGRLGAAAFGNRSNADGERALAVGYNAKAEGMDTIAIGNSNNDKGAKGTNSIAIGAQADADGTQTIYRGKEYTDGTWGNATALGAYTEAGAGATALGASSKARGWNSTAVGMRAEASAANGVALGNASSATREADAKGVYDYVGYSAGVVLSDGEKNSTVWHANMGAVSIGNEDFKTGETDEDGNLLHFQYTRQLTGLAAGTADTDAVNVAQLKRARVELMDGTNTTVNSTNDETDGHVIYSVDVNTNGTINKGDTNIVTGDTVYNALQNVSWKAQVNGKDAKTVAKDGTLNFVNGDNINIINDNGDIKISTTGLASTGDLWTAQAGGKDVKAVDQKVNFNSTDKHLVVESTQDGEITFATKDLADTSFTNITEEGNTYIKKLAKGEDVHIKADTYTVGNDGSVTMTYVDGNGNPVTGEAKITGIAKSDLSNITTEGNTVINNIAKKAVKVVKGKNTTVTTDTDGDATTYAVNVDTSGKIEQNNTNIVTGDTVYKALQNVSWTAKVNGTDAKTVAKDGTLNFVNGDNINIINDNGDIKISTTGLASTGDLWTAQAGGKDVKAVDQKVNFNSTDKHLVVESTQDGEITFATKDLADTSFTNITEEGNTYIKKLAKGEDVHIEAQEYAVNADGSVTMTYVDGNGNTVDGTAKITGIAKSDLTNISEGGKTVINNLAKEAVKVVKGTNTTVTEGLSEDGKTKTYAVNVDNAAIQAATDVTGENGISVTSAVENGVKKYTVSAKLSNNFAIDQATGNIDLAPSISVGKTNPVSINGNTGEITGLSNKTTTAANFADGSGRAATEEQLKEVNSKATAAKTTVTAGKNIAVNRQSDENGSAYTVALADDVSLGNNNAIQLKGSDGSISATSGTSSLNFNDKGLSLSNGTNSTVINGGTITVNGGESVISGTQATFGKIKLNAESGSTIIGLTNTSTKYDGFATAGRAATEEQLKEVAGQAGEAIETAGKGWNLTTNGKESSKTNIKPGGTVDFSSKNDNLLISNAGADLSFSLSDNLDLTKNDSKKGSVKVGENTTLTDELLQVGKDVSLTASALNVGTSSLTTSALTVGGLTYINSSGINANGNRITGVAAGIDPTDAVNVSQLKSAISSSQVSIKAGDGISVAKTGNQYTINVNIEGLSNEHGTVSVSTDSDSSIVPKSTPTESEMITPAPAKRMNSLLLAEEAVVAEPENSTSTGKKMYVKYTSNAVKLITDDITDPTKVADLNDGEEIFFSGDGNITTTTELETDGKNTETIRFSLNKDVKVDSIEAKNGGQINIKSEVNMNSQKITNLADGEIAEGSTDAVNGGQLYNTNQAVIANAENINSLSHSLNKLDSRINRVGAGAAALAALHPLDFDPDNKWDFAAGYGNYSGANAVAIGTYYRPNENTMFSIGGSFGGGENMINAGVSFKLGSGGSGITTSKTVMAKKIKEQDELLKAQDAKMKEQDEKIAKLEALVAQQGEMIQQALGKK